MSPKPKKTATPSTHRKGGDKNRRMAHVPPLFHSDEGLSGLDECSTLKDVVQSLETLTTALAVTNNKVDSLTQHEVPQV